MRLAACILAAFVCSGPTLSQSIETAAKGTLDNEAIVSMTKSGLADDVIVAKIQRAPSVDFSLGTDDLVALKEAGVKPEILAAMIAKAAAVRKLAPTEGFVSDAPEDAPENEQPRSDKVHGNFDIFLGVKAAESAWEEVDDQFEFGGLLSIGRNNWPVDIAVDFLSSEEIVGGCGYGAFLCTRPETLGRTFEVDAGVRKIWKTGKVLPYIGAGVGAIRAEFRTNGGNIYADSSDLALGFWAGTGLLYRPIKILELGLGVRYSTANVDLNFGYGAQSVDAGGFHFGLVCGGYF